MNKHKRLQKREAILPIMPLSLLSRVDVGLVTACPGAEGRVEHGLQAGGEAVLLVRVEHGLILPLAPKPCTHNLCPQCVLVFVVDQLISISTGSPQPGSRKPSLSASDGTAVALSDRLSRCRFGLGGCRCPGQGMMKHGTANLPTPTINIKRHNRQSTSP